MRRSSLSQRNHGHIIAECKDLCPVPSLVEHTLSIHLPTQRQKCSTPSIWRRMAQRIKSILLIRLWLTCRRQQPMPLPPSHLLSLTLISPPLRLQKHLLLYHLFFHPISVLPHPLVAQGLSHLHPFPHHSIPKLHIGNPTLLWAQHIQSLLITRVKLPAVKNASAMQDL
jgi:hypothetical protein